MAVGWSEEEGDAAAIGSGCGFDDADDGDDGDAEVALDDELEVEDATIESESGRVLAVNQPNKDVTLLRRREVEVDRCRLLAAAPAVFMTLLHASAGAAFRNTVVRAPVNIIVIQSV